MKPLLFLALLASICFPSFSQTITINNPTNSIWKYLSQDDDPGFGLDWTHLNFDDSTWPSGNMPLGDPWHEVAYSGMTIRALGGTVVPFSPPSHYFRRTFTWSGPTTQVTIIATNWVDDGAAVFINGNELYRISMVAGNITHNFPRGLSHADVQTRDGVPAGEANGELRIATVTLTNGLNLIAATVRPDYTGVSDLVWAVHMLARFPGPVFFNLNPQDANIVEGQTLILRSEVDDPLASLQWFRNGEAIQSATNANLSISNSPTDLGGSYYVTAQNSFNTATSTVGTVTINPMVITAGPTNILRVEGTEGRFTVSVNGPATYVWSFEDNPIDSGLNRTATNATLILPSVLFSDAGNYSVVVANAFRTLDSVSASLMVTNDVVAPTVVNARALTDLSTITIEFNEPIQESDNKLLYTIRERDSGNTSTVLEASSDSISRIISLWLQEPIDPEKSYLLGFTADVSDRFGNQMSATNTFPIQVPFKLLTNSALWKYQNVGTNLDLAWTLPGFDDSNWASGPASLGFGATSFPFPLRTTVDNHDPNQVPYYFRTQFFLPGNSTNVLLYIEELFEDGAVVFLNGHEVYRVRVNSGPITSQTVANVTVGTPQLSLRYLTNAPLFLGANNLAIAVFQPVTGSSDMSMGYQLTTFIHELQIPYPELKWTRTAAGINFTWNDPTATLQHSDSVAFTNPASLGTNNLSTVVDITNTTGFFRLVK